MVQKKIFRIVFILSLVLFPQIFFAQERGAIRPMIYGEYDKLQLLPSEIWLMEGRPISDIERELLQVSYLRGLYDGLQLSNVGWASVYSVLNELAGMDLSHLREEINRLYKEYAEMRNNPPAIMILEIIPEVRRGVLPVDPGQEKIKKEEVK
jgi:archaellum biogenesis protein FlaJ (TadC family)